ncbi:MAG: putative selenium-dependent hydroxylase accessory protein YqeC [Anaerolineae bacterium]|nr:MAG: putative selenium-dependent hydroxylase accessory protein YqeC [Anaerolineae bacterium]
MKMMAEPFLQLSNQPATTLAAALALSSPAVVSLVGAGGKTSTALRLMDELAQADQQVVLTTTTKILEPIPRPGECLILAATLDAARMALSDPWCRRVFLAHRRLEETDPAFAARAPYPARLNKLAGLPPEWMDALVTKLPDVTFLIEADGARHRPFKAPALHEPVVPAATTLLVPMADLDALGKPLTDEHVHRAGRAAHLLGVPPGGPVTPRLLARLLAHPDGGLKGAPETARIVPILTWWHEERLAEAATEAADRLAAGQGVERVIVANPQAEEPVLYATQPAPVATIVLAAGASRRMGQPKQLLPWGRDGQPMLRHVVQTALAVPVDEVIVVLGHAAEHIAPALAGLPVRVVVNDAWADGLSTSVHAGLNVLSTAAEAALFLLADQPRLTPEVIAALVARFRRTRAPVVVPETGGPRGAPALFARALFDELRAVQGDQGGRDLIARYADLAATVALSDAALLADIDTQDDLTTF